MQGSSKKILIVDDDPMIAPFRRLLGQEHCLAEASSGEEALERLSHFAADLVMLDIILPGIDGYETCRRIRSLPSCRAIQVLMVSAKSSRGEQVRAYAAGADDYVIKPFDPHELCSRVRLHFRLRGALETVAMAGGYGLPFDAFEADEARTRFMAHVHDVTVAALTKVAELRDTETGEHLVRMRSYSQIIAEELGRDGPYTEQIDEQFLEDLYRASPLHDIGKVGINDAILLKPARLTPEEFETMKQHTTIGANILDHVASGAPDASFLGMAAIVARYHHERFDGSGYPAGLRGRRSRCPRGSWPWPTPMTRSLRSGPTRPPNRLPPPGTSSSGIPAATSIPPSWMPSCVASRRWRPFICRPTYRPRSSSAPLLAARADWPPPACRPDFGVEHGTESRNRRKRGFPKAIPPVRSIRAWPATPCWVNWSTFLLRKCPSGSTPWQSWPGIATGAS